MTKLMIINDVHLGVSRVAGTTPSSAAALTEFMAKAFESLLDNECDELCILGDLFDQYQVSNSCLVRTFFALADWLSQDNDRILHLVAGNHDLSKDSSRMSSFETLCELLQRQFETQVVTYFEPSTLMSPLYAYVIPHLPNQDLFDRAIEAVPVDAPYVLFHANYNNGFAEQSDHSLNVSEEQALKLPGTLIFAHEHQTRKALNGKVQVIGNQLPSSVADCLGPTMKYLGLLELDEGGDAIFSREATWSWGGWEYSSQGPAAAFANVVWESCLDVANENLGFIRVTGSASAAQAADVVARISKLRQLSKAFVITNAVQIEGVQQLDHLPATLEAAKSFDVLQALLETLDEPERVVVRQLLNVEER